MRLAVRMVMQKVMLTPIAAHQASVTGSFILNPLLLQHRKCHVSQLNLIWMRKYKHVVL